MIHTRKRTMARGAGGLTGCFRKALPAILLFALLSETLPAATIILVRHAERSNAMSADTPLSPAGQERAKALARVLKDASIRHIYVTEVLRTQQTAEPLAALLHLKPVVIDQKDTDSLLAQLRKLGDDDAALVVGHTATIPLLIERLGGGKAAQMSDSEYDRLTVVITSSGKAHVVVMRYGAAAE